MSSRSRRTRKRKVSPKEPPSVEDYYQNKVFVKPVEKTLETIFEEPIITKDGVEKLTSTKKLRRSLRCDEWPTADKLRKRRKKIKKYFNSSQIKNLNLVKIDVEAVMRQLISEPGGECNSSSIGDQEISLHNGTISEVMLSLVSKVDGVASRSCSG